MIKEIQNRDEVWLREFLEKDIARNYFILLGLISKNSPYEKIFGEYQEGIITALLFKRKSGTLQFYAPGLFDVEGFAELIKTLDVSGMICPKSFGHKFLDKEIFSTYHEGAFISKLSSRDRQEIALPKQEIEELNVQDLDEVVTLYKTCFTSFSPKELMEEKLRTRRGRGVCIRECGEIVCVAQSDFEVDHGALIVGVATKKEARCRGLATQCLRHLIRIFQSEDKDIYLQYDNLEAGRIYERLGFKIMDQVMHYKAMGK